MSEPIFLGCTPPEQDARLIESIDKVRRNMDRRKEIERLEASIERLEFADPDDVCHDEYAAMLHRLVELRRERDSTS